MEPIEKCTCEKSDVTQDSDSSNSDLSPGTKDKKNRLSFQSLGLHLKRGRSLHFRPKRSKKQSESSSANSSPSSKKTPIWSGLKFNCARKEPKVVQETQNSCKCTCYKRTEEHHLGAGVVFNEAVAGAEPETLENSDFGAESANRENRLECLYNPEDVKIEIGEGSEGRGTRIRR